MSNQIIMDPNILIRVVSRPDGGVHYQASFANVHLPAVDVIAALEGIQLEILERVHARAKFLSIAFSADIEQISSITLNEIGYQHV